MKLTLVLLLSAVAIAAAGTAAPGSWSYGAQANWPGLCTSGTAQSPININASHTHCVRHGEPDAQAFRIHFHYHKGLDHIAHQHNHTLRNTGYALQVKGKNLGHITIGGCNPCDGQEYDVKQVNFHAPSEHTVTTDPSKDGHYAMETQIVHQKRGSKGLNDIVIVSILWYKQAPGGFPNSFLQSIDWANAPTDTSRRTHINGRVKLHKLDEALKGEYYSYFGSLVVPPCTEGVQYFVMKRPLGATQHQLNVIQNLFANNPAFAGGAGNNRGIQQLNGRKVWYYRKHH